MVGIRVCSWVQVCAGKCSRRPERGIGLPGVGVTGSLEPPCWCWELNSRPPPEQYTLLTTEQSPLPLITAQSGYFTHLQIPPRVGDNWGWPDQFCGFWVLYLCYLFTQNYALYLCKMLTVRNTIWGRHMGSPLWWNFHDFKKSLGFPRLPKGTTAQASLLGMLPPASVYSWVPVMQGWMRDGHTHPRQCRHTANSGYTQEYSLKPDGCMFKIVDVKEPAKKHVQTRRKNRSGSSVTAPMCYSSGLKFWPDFLLSVLPRQSPKSLA